MSREKILETVRSLSVSTPPTEESFEWILFADEQEICELLREVNSNVDATTCYENGLGFQLLGSNLVRRCEKNVGSFEKMTIQQIVSSYRNTNASDSNRRFFLRMLSTLGGREELEMFSELIATDPPKDQRAIMDAFTPLFQSDDPQRQALFPRLLDALQYVQVAAIVLDLANYLNKQGIINPHPMHDRETQAVELLGGLIQRLELITEQPGQTPKAASQITESVALAISLCQAITLMNAKSAIGKLNQMLKLQHRRCRAEAAFTLLALGETDGQLELVEMAGDPSTRLRALAYAEELRILDQVPRRFKTPMARAEAELVTWLSEPNRFGMPPKSCELLADRCLYWPGYDEPIDCYLYRYTYPMPNSEHTNLGVVGPLTFAFVEDVTCLTEDDLFALFAGWQATHEEILQFTTDQWTDEQQTIASVLMQQLEESRYENAQPQLLGSFFGEPVLICSAELPARGEANEVGHLLADSNGFTWLKHEPSRLPIRAVHAWSVFKGRKLLKSFNGVNDDLY